MPNATVMTLTKLYFGLNIGNERTITPNEFRCFLLREVAPRFPGFTVYEATGWWRGEVESSRVVEVIWPSESTLDAAAIEHIREAYKVAFSQESVLRVDDAVGVSF